MIVVLCRKFKFLLYDTINTAWQAEYDFSTWNTSEWKLQININFTGMLFSLSWWATHKDYFLHLEYNKDVKPGRR